MKGERLVAGLRCSEVVARLDAYADGTLSEADRAAVVAHVAGCTLCEDFGGRYAATIAALRRLAATEAPDPERDAAKARALDSLRRLR